MELGKIGVWRRRLDGLDALEEIEALGYGTFWVGGSPSVEQARAYLERTSRMTIATGILNVWRHEPADVAAQHAAVRRDFPGRFLLGIGIGHPEATAEYQTPLQRMRCFFDGLDAGQVPRNERAAAALGPKMLDLAAERSLGAHPYFTTAEHTRFAREYAATYIPLHNYAGNLLELGYDDSDLADGGSDRLIDAVVPHGSADAVAEAVRAHLDAGAEHVCLQPLGHGPHPADDYRALAAALGL